jgi:hypothetical protein
MGGTSRKRILDDDAIDRADEYADKQPSTTNKFKTPPPRKRSGRKTQTPSTPTKSQSGTNLPPTTPISAKYGMTNIESCHVQENLNEFSFLMIAIALLIQRFGGTFDDDKSLCEELLSIVNELAVTSLLFDN